METISLSFEGITQNPTYQQYNRYGNIQNGSYWRFFTSQSEKIEYQISFIQKSGNLSGNVLDLGHVNGAEFPHTNIEGAWAFAKYQITFTIGQEKYKCYFNSLDSRYGVDTSYGAYSSYGRDWHFRYDNSLTANRRLVCYWYSDATGTTPYDTLSCGDTLSNGEPSKEFKVWELIL